MSIVITLQILQLTPITFDFFQGKEVAWHEAGKHELLFIIFFIAL